MEIKTIDPIPDCCGSCRSFGTMAGAFCITLSKPTYAMGFCRFYVRKSEYRADQPEAIKEECPCCGFYKTLDGLWHAPEAPTDPE